MISVMLISRAPIAHEGSFGSIASVA